MANLTSGSSEYFEIPAFTPAGDFKVEVEVELATGVAEIVASDNLSTDGIYIDYTGGDIQAFAYVSSSLQTAITHTISTDDALHKIRLEYVGTTATLFVDGVSVGSQTWALNGSQSVQYIGRRDTVYNTGIIRNVGLWDDDDLVRFYKINETFNSEQDVIADSTAVDTPELHTHDGLTGWFEPRSSTTLTDQPPAIRSSGDGVSTFGASCEITGMSVGAQYVIESSVTTIVDKGGSYRLRFDSNSSLAAGNIVQPTGSFTSTAVVTPTNSTMYFGVLLVGHTSGAVFDIEIMSIKRRDTYGTAVNITSSDAQNYTFDGDVSPNTWTGDDATVIEVAGT